MEYQFFKRANDLAELKSQYRKLCKSHHPDLDGGDLEIMKIINLEYETVLRSGRFNQEFADTNTSVDIEAALRDVIQKTCAFKHLSIEICGRWIWFTGETWRYKKFLKEYGCKWSSKKGAWYWKPSDERSKRRGSWSLDQIRTKYGSQGVNMKYHKEVAA